MGYSCSAVTLGSNGLSCGSDVKQYFIKIKLKLKNVIV
jgi:hypothetical protein